MNFKRYINEVIDKDQIEVSTEKNSITEIIKYLNEYFNDRLLFSSAVVVGKTLKLLKRKFRERKKEIVEVLKEIGFKYLYVYNDLEYFYFSNKYEKNNSDKVVKIDDSLNESLDKLHDAVEKIIKDMQKEGNVKPEHIADRVQKALKLDLTREEIIRRYIRNVGGQFDSQM